MILVIFFPLLFVGISKNRMEWAFNFFKLIILLFIINNFLNLAKIDIMSSKVSHHILHLSTIVKLCQLLHLKNMFNIWLIRANMYVGLWSFVSMGVEKRKQPFVKENNFKHLHWPQKHLKGFWMSCPPMSINSRSWSSLEPATYTTRISSLGFPSPIDIIGKSATMHVFTHVILACSFIVLMWFIAKL
jgi:hypothetical protein